ncbi:unnamed protein product [marine sediment metagenome]|uniref:Uncharacterized protein n=1 Tax=marine sediment metagenome TaxID=412755 RepID=X1UW78_9ZZZZ
MAFKFTREDDETFHSLRSAERHKVVLSKHPSRNRELLHVLEVRHPWRQLTRYNREMLCVDVPQFGRKQGLQQRFPFRLRHKRAVQIVRILPDHRELENIEIKNGFL